MKIAAMLSWFDEPEALLRRCVANAASVCDTIVAFDGSYEMTPGKASVSPPEQSKMIFRTADRCGYETIIVYIPKWVIPDARWQGEIAKRTAMMQRAALVADWLLVVNADWFVSGDRHELEQELAATDAEQFAVMFENGDHVQRNEFLFRAMPKMRVEQNHWMYSGLRKNGERVGLWGGDALYPKARTEDLQARLTITHRCDYLRSNEQIARNVVLYRRIAEHVKAHETEP